MPEKVRRIIRQEGKEQSVSAIIVRKEQQSISLSICMAMTFSQRYTIAPSTSRLEKQRTGDYMRGKFENCQSTHRRVNSSITGIQGKKENEVGGASDTVLSLFIPQVMTAQIRDPPPPPPPPYTLPPLSA